MCVVCMFRIVCALRIDILPTIFLRLLLVLDDFSIYIFWFVCTNTNEKKNKIPTSTAHSLTQPNTQLNSAFASSQ